MKAAAWLLKLNGGLHVAVGERELTYIVSDEVERVFVPRAPSHVKELIVWQNRLLPLFDVSAALRDDHAAGDAPSAPTQTGGTIIVIAAYQVSDERQIDFGALPVCALPERVEVADDSACDLPSEPLGWRRLAHACCELQHHGAVPILDLHRMFAPNESIDYPIERNVRQ